MTRRRTARTWGLGGLATAMSLATMGSAAFACTAYLGKMTVTGAGLGGAGSATANGAGTFDHVYCNNVFPTRGNIITTGLINVTVAPAPSSCGGSSLVAGTYDVFWGSGAPTEILNRPNSGPTDPEFFNCNSSAVQNGAKQLLGTLQVTSGNGSGTFDLLTKATPGPGSICVNNPTSLAQVKSAPQVYINWI